MDEMERQNVDMSKMLDPKARWPRARGLEGRINSPGLDLLQVAKRATTTDYKRRPITTEVRMAIATSPIACYRNQCRCAWHVNTQSDRH